MRRELIARSYGVMVSTLDFESNNPSSILGRTFPFLIIFSLSTILIIFDISSNQKGKNFSFKKQDSEKGILSIKLALQFNIFIRLHRYKTKNLFCKKEMRSSSLIPPKDESHNRKRASSNLNKKKEESLSLFYFLKFFFCKVLLEFLLLNGKFLNQN